MNREKQELVDLYRKIKDGNASEDEQILFNVKLEMQSFSKEYIITELEKILNSNQ